MFLAMIPVAWIAVFTFNHRHHPTTPQTAAVGNYTAPDFSSKGRQEYGTAGAGDFTAPDSGNVVDLNGDGIDDFVKLDGESLMWFKGRKNGTFDGGVCVLIVRDFCRGYYVRIQPGHKRPTFLSWDKDYHHFRQECLGVNSKGIPIFGDVEQ